MAYVITGPCVGEAIIARLACVAVCPADCIVATEIEGIYVIDPDACIDCGACVPACPLSVIYPEEAVPEDRSPWKAVNAEYFTSPRAEYYVKFGAFLEAVR